MSLTITGNSILDFALVQSLSIIYLSEAVLPMVKWQTSDDVRIKEMAGPPAAALYNKVSGSTFKSLSGSDKPCLITTGLSIQTLSRLADMLPNFISLDQCFLANPAYPQDWKTTAGIQLEYCLEYMAEHPCTIAESSAVLEGGCCLQEAGYSNLEAEANHKEALGYKAQEIISEFDIDHAATLDIACAVRAVSSWLALNGATERSSFLTAAGLEILNRKSKSGLLDYGPYGYASVTMGQQFFILDALLRSYPYIMLDNVLEDVFDFFSSLYNIAYRQAFNILSFKRKYISYTAFDTSAVLSCLANIARYSSDSSDQKETINQLIDTFLDYITNSYMTTHSKEISRLLKWIFLSQDGKARADKKPVIGTIFPKRLQFRFPGPTIDWSRKGIISQADTLYLCSTLLSLLDGRSRSQDDNSSVDLDLPALEAFRMLMELIKIIS